MIKNKCIFAIDLDGTLLPKTKKIPFLTKHYLRKINKQGYKVILASGRPAHNVKKFYDKLKLDCPIVALNGLNIHYPNNLDLNSYTYFPTEKIKRIVELINQNFKIINIINQSDHEIYITNKEAYLNPEFWLTNMKVIYGTLEENLKHQVMTFIIELDKKCYDEVKLKSLFKDGDYKARRWPYGEQCFIEIYSRFTNKSNAVKTIAKEMGVPIESVYAFGDDLNDIDLMLDLPNAYAMKNCVLGVKKIARKFTKYDNEHEGVKKEIQRIIKNLKNSN